VGGREGGSCHMLRWKKTPLTGSEEKERKIIPFMNFRCKTSFSDAGMVKDHGISNMHTLLLALSLSI
jgi:hypothetical protein